MLLFAYVAFQSYRADPAAPRIAADRELRINMLASGERVVHEVAVFQRSIVDYYRATRGLLVLTNRRLLYVGLEPRDLLSSPDAPASFEERNFPLDTLVQVRAGRTFFGIAHALIIRTPDERLTLGVPSVEWRNANVLLYGIQARDQRLRAIGAVLAHRRELLQYEWTQAAARARRERLYIVRRGDALSSVAARWNVAPDQLRAWNHLSANVIKVGQRLIVKPPVIP